MVSHSASADFTRLGIEALALMETDPHGAADRFELMAELFLDLARRCREATQDGMQAPGGMGDRVRMAVIGPDGVVRQRVDTGREGH